MLERPIRTLALLAGFFVLAGWVFFAVAQGRDQTQAGTAALGSREAVAAPDPTPGQERLREQRDGTVHEAIDDVDDVLLAPFAGVAEHSSSEWARRTAPSALAFALYCVGGLFLARYASGAAIGRRRSARPA